MIKFQDLVMNIIFYFYCKTNKNGKTLSHALWRMTMHELKIEITALTKTYTCLTEFTSFIISYIYVSLKHDYH